MYHWSVDVEHLKKFPEQYRIWQLEQLINFGLRGEKLNRAELKNTSTSCISTPPRKNTLNLYWTGPRLIKPPQPPRMAELLRKRGKKDWKRVFRGLI